MMGRTHAATGMAAWLAGCAAATALGHPPGIYELAVGTPLAAFGAIWPDIDCPSSSVAHSLGLPTVLLARAVAWAGKTMHADTRTDQDGHDHDGHRTVTHTLLFAILTTGAFAVLGMNGAHWAVTTATALAVGTALRALRVRGVTRVVLTVAAVGAAWWWPAPSGAWLGWAIGAGALVHILGDLQTNTGVPLAWPVPIHGRRWYKFRAPGWWRFETGADGNPEGFIRWACTCSSVVALPVMAYLQWPPLADLTHQVIAALAA